MTSSVQALLSAIVDYAGLFPPAQLSLPQAVGNYEQDRRSPQAWMLGRFVLPAGRVQELARLADSSRTPEPWPLSVVLSGNLASVMKQVKLLQSLPAQVAIAALELPPLPPDSMDALLPQLPHAVDAFFEIPFTDPEPHLKVLKGTGAFAKIRTGGIRAEAFPTTTQLSQFILACMNAQVPFKATAGLHHALPGHYRLTYEPESLTGVMHGFLNVAIAAAFAYKQVLPEEKLSEILQEPLAWGEATLKQGSGFLFQADGIRWGNYQLSLSAIQETRQHFFHGFGSCSFKEPVDDLIKLQLLEASPIPC